MTEQCGELLLMLEHLYPRDRIHVIDHEGGGITLVMQGSHTTCNTREETASLIALLRKRCERENLPEYVWKEYTKQ